MYLLQGLALPMVHGFLDEFWKDTVFTQTLGGWLKQGYRTVIIPDEKDGMCSYPHIRTPLRAVKGGCVIEPGTMIPSRGKWEELNYCVSHFPTGWFTDPSDDFCEGKKGAISALKTFFEKGGEPGKLMLLLSPIGHHRDDVNKKTLWNHFIIYMEK